MSHRGTQHSRHTCRPCSTIGALTILTFVSIIDVQAFAPTVGVTYPSVSAWIVYLQPDTIV